MYCVNRGASFRRAASNALCEPRGFGAYFRRAASNPLCPPRGLGASFCRAAVPSGLKHICACGVLQRWHCPLMLAVQSPGGHVRHLGPSASTGRRAYRMAGRRGIRDLEWRVPNRTTKRGTKTLTARFTQHMCIWSRTPKRGTKPARFPQYI